jgi:VanZ family protein
MPDLPQSWKRMHLMQRPIIKAILRWLPAVAWMAVIFWFSSQPDLPRPASDLLNLILRKTAHFTVFGVLALFYLWGLGTGRLRWLAFVLTVLYAMSDEYHQSWTPLRQPAWTDVVIDTAGGGCALWVAPRLYRRAIAGTTQSSAGDPGQANVETPV